MIYPKFLSKGDIVGITAPSDGIVSPIKLKRLDNAIKNFEKLGLNIKETSNVRTSIKGRSASAEQRAKQLEDLYENKNVTGIICSSGGDFLMEMLPYLNYEKIKNNPKWLQGYSDPTALLYTITTNLDIATIYANNFGEFGMKNYHKSLNDNIQILKGNIVEQNSFEKYQDGFIDLINGDEEYVLTKNVYWENLNNEEIVAKGRIIGGCLDVLDVIVGTTFDKTLEFIEKYKNDGIIWYFENCELTNESVVRAIWRFKQNGWFKYTKAIVFGRSLTDISSYETNFQQVIQQSFKDTDIPIILNADIGHVSPRMTIINGAMATVTSKNGKGNIKFELI